MPSNLYDPFDLARFIERHEPDRLERLRNLYSADDESYDDARDRLAEAIRRTLTGGFSLSVDPADIDEALSIAQHHPTAHLRAGAPAGF